MNELQERLQARQESSRAFIPPLPMDSPRIGVSRALAPIKIAKPKMSRAEALADMDEKRAKATEIKKAARRKMMNRVFREIKRARPCTVVELCSALRMKPVSLRTYVRLLAADGRVVSKSDGRKIIISLPGDKATLSNKNDKDNKKVKNKVNGGKALLTAERNRINGRIRASVLSIIKKKAPCPLNEIESSITPGISRHAVGEAIRELARDRMIHKVYYSHKVKWCVTGVDYGRITFEEKILQCLRDRDGDGWMSDSEIRVAIGNDKKRFNGSEFDKITALEKSGMIEHNGMKTKAARWRVVRGA